MWFERMRFECVDGWEVKDGNVSHKNGENLFSGSAAIMQPQDIRQYVYILTPTSFPSFPVTHAPGTIIPLGRLDLAWRSSFGEPGRLLTSVCRQSLRASSRLISSPLKASHSSDTHSSGSASCIGSPSSPPTCRYPVPPALPTADALAPSLSTADSLAPFYAPTSTGTLQTSPTLATSRPPPITRASRAALACPSRFA